MTSSNSEHCERHEDLKPGISISGLEGEESASTLGVLFKIEKEPYKRFILTVKHGVGEKNEFVIQPGRLDEGNEEDRCAIVSQFGFRGVYRFPEFENNEKYKDYKGHLLDYAFCEINDRSVENPSNRPLKTNIIIKKIKEKTNENTNLKIEKDEKKPLEVQKVGRKTTHTYGKISGEYLRIRNRTVSDNPLYAFKVYGDFGNKGDSGAPVFDKDGMLWGIFHSIKNTKPKSPNPEAVVIPIHLILTHAKKEFGVEFKLL